MASLLGLSNELILQIIDETRPESIWNFVRCCKKIWILGANDLSLYWQDFGRYTTPSFYYWDPWPTIEFDAYQFLFDILDQPRRARYVIHLSTLSRAFKFRRTRLAFSATMLDVLYEIHSQLFMIDGGPYLKGGEFKKFLDKMYRGDTNAVVCLILTLLPNLETLTISDYDDQIYTDLILKASKEIQSPHRMIPGPLPLSRLETITINDTRTISQLNGKLGIYEVCTTLPSMRRLKGKYVNSAFDRWPSKEECPLEESNVIEIVFDRSAINANGFRRLLTRTKHIQLITYSFVKLLGIYGDYSAGSFKKILEQHTTATLTHLDLDFNGHEFRISGRYIGSLRQFKVLKHLRIQANMFIDDDICDMYSHRLIDLIPLLPSSIVTLNLLSQPQDPSVVYTLAEVEKKREIWIPSMKEVVCENEIPIAEGLEDACARVGIRLVCL